MQTEQNTQIVKGGSFLIESVMNQDIMTYEDLNEEQRMFAKTVRDFMNNEVLTCVEEIETMQEGVLPRLLRRAGEIGLLMVDIPEEYGGLELPKTTAGFVHSQIACMPSFAVAFGGHVGIGTLPLLYFGTPEQKAKYLPRLAIGEILAAYALTEPNSGSDALGARARAVLTEDGRFWRLNGTKQFITNAGFADLFTVFAKVDGEAFSCFLVERGFPGVSIGAEEKKMGLKGSSTCTLILEDALVPRENLLGEIGKGHVIAFNILNIGRWQLGHKAIERCKYVLKLGIDYIKERKQFGQSLSQFEAIQKKVAKIVTHIYAGDSMAFRILGNVDHATSLIPKNAPNRSAQKIKVIEEYAIEAAIMKILGTEYLADAVDEGVQMLGGYGFVSDYPMERFYRDSRVERIFEGTNEINRILIITTLIKRAQRGQLDVFAFLKQIAVEVNDSNLRPEIPTGPLGQEIWALEMSKRAFGLLLSASMERYGETIRDAQQILEQLSEMAMDIFAVDSTIARTLKGFDQKPNPDLLLKVTQVVATDALDHFSTIAQRLLPALFKPEDLQAKKMLLQTFLPWLSTDVITLRKDIARVALNAGAYPL